MENKFKHSEIEEIYRHGVELNKVLLERSRTESIYERQGTKVYELVDALQDHQPFKYIQSMIYLYCEAAMTAPDELVNWISGSGDDERFSTAASLFLCGLLRK